MEQTGKITQIGYLCWIQLDAIGMGSIVIQIMLLLNCSFSFPPFLFLSFSFLFFSVFFLFFEDTKSNFIQYSDFSGGYLIMDWQGQFHLS